MQVRYLTNELESKISFLSSNILFIFVFSSYSLYFYTKKSFVLPHAPLRSPPNASSLSLGLIIIKSRWKFTEYKETSMEELLTE